MRGVELGLAQRRGIVRGEAQGAHEIDGVIDLARHFLEAGAGIGLLHEAHGPFMDAREIGIATAGKGAQQVERRRRLAISEQQPLRVGVAGLGGEGDVVDDVAAIGRQRDAVDGLCVGGARLGELAGDASHLDHRLGRAVGQDDRHLQEDTEEIADVVGAVLGKALGAIAPLQQEGVAARDVGQLRGQFTRLTGEDERGKALELGFRRREPCGIRIGRNLGDRLLPPARRGPVRHFGCASRVDAGRFSPRLWTGQTFAPLR